MIGTQESFTVTGGARIGWMHAGRPLAKLSASATTLSVRAALLGTYTFAPDDVIALESYGSIPIIGRGIRILHSRSDYPEQIIFSCLRNPERLLDDIRLAGFQPRATQTSRVRSRGMPVRWPPIIAMVVAWNVLFLLDFVAWEPPKRPGPFALVAVGLLLAAAFAVQRSATVQTWVMKPGRSVTEIAPVLRVVQVISGFLLVGWSLFSFTAPLG